MTRPAPRVWALWAPWAPKVPAQNPRGIGITGILGMLGTFLEVTRKINRDTHARASVGLSSRAGDFAEKGAQGARNGFGAIKSKSYAGHLGVLKVPKGVPRCLATPARTYDEGDRAADVCAASWLPAAAWRSVQRRRRDPADGIGSGSGGRCAPPLRMRREHRCGGYVIFRLMWSAVDRDHSINGAVDRMTIRSIGGRHCDRGAGGAIRAARRRRDSRGEGYSISSRGFRGLHRPGCTRTSFFLYD
jgi:hypothetical protein